MAEAEAEARAGSARHQCPPDTGLAGALPVGTEVTTVAAPDDVPPAKPIPRTARAWPLRAPAITEFRWLRAPAVTRHLVPYARLAPLAFLVVAFTVRFATASVDTLRTFQQDAYDLALYDQGIWLLSRFHAPFMTVMGTDMFAAHTVFIFVLLVPLYWIYPHTAALLVVQAMALASGAVPVYLLGRRLLSSRTLSTLLAAAYLLNPSTPPSSRPTSTSSMSRHLKRRSWPFVSMRQSYGARGSFLPWWRFCCSASRTTPYLLSPSAYGSRSDATARRAWRSWDRPSRSR